jgi:hypothetical protein
MPCVLAFLTSARRQGKHAGACLWRKVAWRKARKVFLPGIRLMAVPENTLTLFFSCPLYYRILYALTLKFLRKPVDNKR